MYFKLKDNNGNVFHSYMKGNHKPVIVINDTEYELLEMTYLHEENSLTPSQIAEFDSDPEIREMIEQSKKDIAEGNVFSTKQMMDMIRSGEI